MSRIKKSLFALVLCFFLLSPQVCIGDETDVLIPSVIPDALIVLDLSFSMACNINLDLSSCTDTSGAQDWSRLGIAKKAIKSIFDYNGDTRINGDDETALGVRIGYMSFVGCSVYQGSLYNESSLTDPYSGCNAVRVKFPAPGDVPPFTGQSQYSDLWNSVNNSSTNNRSGTALVFALDEARLYLNDSKDGNAGKNVPIDSYKDCRQKFAILVTDGRDTCSCSGNCTNNDAPDNYKRRRSTVAKAKALADAGYKVFVIGIGSVMGDKDIYTLNWAAYFGNTDNPLAEKPYSPLKDDGITLKIKAESAPTDSCRVETDNDPGSEPLLGYAFMADDTESLKLALQAAFTAIRDSRYSFSVTSVSSSRTAVDNLAYAASFQPKADPFWRGFITESTINTDGSLTAGWEAGSILNGNTARNIQTYTGGSPTAFQGTAWGTWPSLLATDTNGVKMIIPYIRGDATPDNWKLGDIFHSNPVTIGKPNPYFEDPRDRSKGYDAYINRSDIKARAKIVVAGANDGQLHAFNGSTGAEVWSFIPPNLLPKLKYLAHAVHPTSLTHQSYVDGPISAGDVWVPAVDGPGTAKNDSDWKTYLVFGEGKGVRDNTGAENRTLYLWSKSQSCDLNFNSGFRYSATYKYYCGYHGLDVTDTRSTPVYKWIINSDPALKTINGTHGPYLGEPWSKMAIGKVLISGNEKWVGFMGGGYGQSGDVGKGFFVIDLKDGHILWSRTGGDLGYSAMSQIPASPTIVDTDVDGFIDTAYVGDLSGNMWRFTFCTQAQGASCSTGNWGGGRFFQPSTNRPVYTAATFARDWKSNLWVFWGTGDKMSPNSTGSGNAGTFYAVKDNSRSGAYGEAHLQNITGSPYTNESAHGWFISLNSGGEKMLADPTVFGGMLLFTTYIPYAGTNPCVSAGTSYLWALAMQRQPIGGGIYDPGAGLLSAAGGGATRTISLGSGIASAPTISQSSPGAVTSFFVSVSGGSGAQGGTATTSPTVTKTKLDFDQNSGLIKRLGETGVSTQILHWRDGRIQ